MGSTLSPINTFTVSLLTQHDVLIIQMNSLSPFTNPETEELLSEGSSTDAIPKEIQLPTPTAGVLPFNVAVVIPTQYSWSVPALDGLADRGEI